MVTLLAWSSRPMQSLPRAFVVAPAMLLMWLKEKYAPSRPRVPKPGTGLLGVVLGLLLFMSLPVLLVGLFLTVGSAFEAAPDWNLEVQQRVSEHSIRERVRLSADGRFGPLRLTPAQWAAIQHESEVELDAHREAWKARRKDETLGSLQVVLAGAIGLALALGVQRLRTMPAS